jgi:uncharacterized protein YlbG (UPF0298 family)
MIGNRIGIAVWVNTLKNVKILRKYGHLMYVSKKMKYAVLYCDMSQLEETIAKLEKLHFVKKAEPSYKPFIKTEFQNARPDKAKEYDYKMGL